MKKFFKTVKNFIRETDKILFLLCTLTSAFGCIAVLSATMWTAPEGERFSRDFMIRAISIRALMKVFTVLLVSLSGLKAS